MKEAKTIDELIREKGLTPEEIEMHRELIDECRNREQRIREYAAEARGNLEKLAESLQTVAEKTNLLASMVTNLIEERDSLYLRLLPEDQFYRE